MVEVAMPLSQTVALLSPALLDRLVLLSLSGFPIMVNLDIRVATLLNRFCCHVPFVGELSGSVVRVGRVRGSNRLRGRGMSVVQY